MATFYAGIGSRQTPPDILRLFIRLAIEFGRRGYVLRTGAAQGADQAFMDGCPPVHAQIFKPWLSYESHYPYKQGWDIHSETFLGMLELASQYHPAWHKCSHAIRKLHARNMPIIVGPHGDEPVDFVVCYTPGGNGGGGTGQALRLAQSLDIPIYDMGVPQCTFEFILKHTQF